MPKLKINKVGAPPKPASKKLSHEFTLRLTPSQADWLEKECSISELSKGAYIRSLIEKCRLNKG